MTCHVRAQPWVFIAYMHSSAIHAHRALDCEILASIDRGADRDVILHSRLGAHRLKRHRRDAVHQLVCRELESRWPSTSSVLHINISYRLTKLANEKRTHPS